jgi:hypothetical protein
MTKDPSIPDLVKENPTWFRLQNQRKWYSKESAANKKKYYRIKMVQIVFAGLIPILSLIDYSVTKYIVAIFGAAIAVLEGIQQLFQFHNLWIEYRSTSEHLKHEEYLFLALSGPYRDLNIEDGLLLLAERIEEHISKEHAKWVSISKKAESDTSKNIKNP